MQVYDIENKIIDCYSTVLEMEGDLFAIQDDTQELMNDTSINDLCSITEIFDKISNIIKRANSLIIKIPVLITQCAELIMTCAGQIILRKLELIRLKLEKVSKQLQLKIVEIKRNALKRMLDGEGSSPATPEIVAINTKLSKLSSTIQKMSKISSMILTSINAMTPLNVEGGDIAFFPTIKSVKKVAAVINNPGGSISNCLGQAITQKIAESVSALKAEKVAEKNAAIEAKAAASSTAVSEVYDYTLPAMGVLTNVSVSTITTLVNTMIQSLGMAEPLPRYEKLNILNARFMMWLITGFCPAGYKTFGIPNMP